LNLGLVADGKANRSYSAAEAMRISESVLGLLDVVDRKLEAVATLDLDKEDRDGLEQIRVLSGLLRRQGKDLQTFWETGKEEDAAKYESGRKDSWAALSRLTGLGQ
jgi:hypothetical protein